MGELSNPRPAIRAPSPGEGKRGTGGHIGYLLRQAAAAYRLRLERILTPLCITPPQFAVMTMLKAYPGLSNAEIAKVALLTAPTVTVILRNLEANGLVQKRQHQTHGRIQSVSLTRAGTVLLARCRSKAEEIEADLLEAGSVQDQHAVKRWLVYVARSIVK